MKENTGAGGREREGEEEVLVGVGGDNHLYFVIRCWGAWVSI